MRIMVDGACFFCALSNNYLNFERNIYSMTSEQQMKLAYRLAIVLFIVGVLSYAAFSAPTPDQPVRMIFKVAAGNVLFDHKAHSDISGIAASCGDCHHTLEESEYKDAEACGKCHKPESDDEDVPRHSEAFHQQCIGCHVDFGAGPGDSSEDCSLCHVL
jgi:hypothetical protein